MSSLSRLTVAKLKEQLAERGLTRTGRKADLVARLLAAGEMEGQQVADPLDLLAGELETHTGSKLFLLELPAVSSAAGLMACRHLLLPGPAGTLAKQVSDQLRELKGTWPYGDTSLGNEVWERHMFPELAKARQAIRKKKWREALGRLVGILLYACSEEGWIADNEVWQEHKRFTKWFTDIGTAWQAVLGREDLEVGLEVQGGKQGGYRGTLITLLKR